MDVLDRADLPFPHSLPEFQRLFPDDAACAAYLECIAPGSLDTSLSHAAGLSDIAVCHA